MPRVPRISGNEAVRAFERGGLTRSAGRRGARLQRQLPQHGPEHCSGVQMLAREVAAPARMALPVGVDLIDRCGGLLKPDVVFFGENVPPARVDDAREALAGADAVLVAGSSLMVYSGFRFVRFAHDLGLPIAIVNRGRTRGDAFAALKVEGDVGAVLSEAITAASTDSCL